MRLGILSLLLAACMVASPGCAPDDPDAAPDVGSEGATDGGADARLHGALLEANLEALLADYVHFSGEANAALAVDAPGLVVWRGGAGLLDLAKDAPAGAEAAFRAGSATKLLVASVVLQLVEEGLLALEDPLGAHLEGYPAWEGITIRQLLGMRSGIPDYLMEPLLWMQVVLDPTQPIAPEDILGVVGDKPLDFLPGETCLYSNTNYIVLGLVIEAVTGRGAHEELRERIIEPLGLEHSYLDVEGAADERLAHGYMDPRLAFLELDVPLEMVALIPEEYLAAEGLIDCTYIGHPSISWTAGALVTTPQDLNRTVRALLDGEVVGPEVLAEMTDTSSCQILAETSDYGLGLMAWETPAGRARGHGGLVYGYSGKSAYIEAADLAYTHLVGAYPAQDDALVAGLHEVLSLPAGVTLPVPCPPPPEPLVVGVEERLLSFRFRGVVQPAQGGTSVGAIAKITAIFADGHALLYGAETMARVAEDGVRVDSVGPPRRDGWVASRCLLTISGTLLGAEPASDGIVRCEEVGAELTALLLDVREDPEAEAPIECVFAVSDPAGPAALRVCDPDQAATPGALLRLHGAAGLTQDPDAIAAALVAAGQPYVPCPPEGW